MNNFFMVVKELICIKIRLKKLPRRPELLFSYAFDGIIWNMLESSENKTLLLEVRRSADKTVSFAAYDYGENRFLWRDVTFEEPWWINLSAVVGGMVLFTVYTETNNPDQKSLVAYRLQEQSIAWWRNDFSLTAVSGSAVTGFSYKTGMKELTLDGNTGQAMEPEKRVEASQNLTVLRPFHYKAGEAGFETIRTYMAGRFGGEPVLGVDYLEYGDLILISYYVREPELANHLIVLDTEGNVMMQEKAGQNLSGIGVDTFFVLEGSLIFVKNKSEFLRYKLI
jgi:hypothetical protein